MKGVKLMKIFHHNDNDGRAAAAIVSQHAKDTNPNNYIEVDYTKPFPFDSVEDGEEVWIVDLSISTDHNAKAVLDLVKRCCDVVWIDHHVSSFDMIKKYPELNNLRGFRSIDRCAAYLTYEYCFGFDTPDYIALIDDQDRHSSLNYIFGDHTKYFKLALQSVPNGPLDDIWGKLKSDPEDTLNEMIKRGKIIDDYKKQTDHFYRTSFGYESEFDGLKCFVVNRRSDSDVFEDLIDKYPLLIVWVYNGSKYIYTLFSRNKDINCASIAAKYGGGGHPGAAGFSSDKLLVLGQNR